jgi:hypothetical protein
MSGRVLSEDGASLRNLRVNAFFWDAQTRRWVRPCDESIEVQRDGSFEGHTILEELPERFSVSASARGCVGTTVEAEPGERGIQLVLKRGGGLAGRFVTADKAALPLLSVLIEGEGFHREPDIGLGHFRVDGLPPGTYSVVAKAHGTDWRFGGVEGVVVPAGGFADDPRLESIDLGGACRVLRLKVLDPEGEPISRRYVWIQDLARDGGNFRTDEAGELVALVPASAEELSLFLRDGEQRLVASWSAVTGYEGSIRLRAQDR